MLWLIIMFLAFLAIAPIRQRFFATWRFTLPALAGLVIGLYLAAFLVTFGTPPWTMLFLPAVMAIGLGTEGRRWLDKNFGPPRDRWS